MHNSAWWTLHLTNYHMIYWTLLVMHLEGAQYTFCSTNYQTECYFKKIHIDFIYILNSLLDMNTSSMFLSPCRLVCPFLNLVFWGFFGCFFFGGVGGWGGIQPFEKWNPAFFTLIFTQTVSSWKIVLNLFWYVWRYVCVYVSIVIYLFSTSFLV